MPDNSQPVSITVTHPPTLSGADVLNIVNAALDTDAPVIIQALPVSQETATRVSAYVTLGELGLGIINQIVQAIHAAHTAKTTVVNVAGAPAV